MLFYCVCRFSGAGVALDVATETVSGHINQFAREPNLTDRRARWLLPTLEVLWGIVTFAQCRVTNVHQIYACRFIVGMLEAPVFAGIHFILGL